MKRCRLRSLIRSFVLLLGLTAPAAAFGQQGDGTSVSVQVSTVKPDKVPVTPERVKALKVPTGFAVNVFASGLKNPRMLAVAPNGDIYVSRRDQGDVLLLRDTNADGVADGAPVPVMHRAGAHGLAIHDNKLYVVAVKEVFVAPILGDGKLGEPKMIAGDLPDAGQHADRSIAYGPDNMLYIQVGSTCNACEESNPENATLIRMSPDGKSRGVFARGLRNTIGFAWHPKTGELWGMDHGIDYLGDDLQEEELNLIELGKMYGWPHIWANNGVNPQSTPPGGITKEQWKAASTVPALLYTAHAAPMSLLFYSGGNFPAEFQGDGFVTMRGSWNRATPSGYEIVRLRMKDGKPDKFESFVSGFLTDGGKTHIARPVGLAMAKDGSLLMADDGNGTIFRISYTGSMPSKTPAMIPPASAMDAQTKKGIGVPLTLAREETSTSKTMMNVSSMTIKSGAPIPQKHSEYSDGVSPQLTWTAVAGAKSYAIIMEDPDAKPITPFVHWVAWNIPSTETSLPEGLPETLRLTMPEGMMQGRTSRNSIGYFGPQPPVGDAPHHYHIQILALDVVLDLKIGSNRDDVLASARGHVIGKGELVGTFQQTVKPPKSGTP